MQKTKLDFGKTNFWIGRIGMTNKLNQTTVDFSLQ